MAIRTYCDICENQIIDDLMDGISVKVESLQDAGENAYHQQVPLVGRFTTLIPPTLDIEVHVGCLPEVLREMFEEATNERREILAAHEQAQDEDED